MAIYWENNILKFNLKYWIKRNETEGRKDSIGEIKFNLVCEKLPVGRLQMGPSAMAVALRMRCGMLIKNLAFKHNIYEEEISDILSLSMCNCRVNVDSIEPDNIRLMRELKQQNSEA